LARLGVPEPGVAGACARAAGARLRARATAAVVTPRIPETIAAAVVADRQPGPVADRLHPDLDVPRPRVRRDVPERFLSAPVEERLGGGAQMQIRVDLQVRLDAVRAQRRHEVAERSLETGVSGRD